MTLSALAALLFALLSLGVCAFQLALILGAPWGEFTLGGKWRGALPRRARWIPFISLLVFAGLVLIVLAGSGFALTAYQAQAQTWIWGVVGYCALGCVLNAITPSRRERVIWLPVVLGLFASSLSVALLP
ncbi:hypothetical protein [Roseateles sp.]|uniref:hypothetical protein n=1 Tax=Roseateles sp. TaxID=1971397 RepID=UPI003BA79568